VKAQIRRNSREEIRSRHIDDTHYVSQDGKTEYFMQTGDRKMYIQALFTDINNALEFFIVLARKILLVR